MTVMLDSGVRRGADILIALCLGAQFVTFGRPALYGAVAGGLHGVKKAIDIIRTEIDLVMGQIGCPSLTQLGPDFLWCDDWPHNR
jgi:(S)-mandelate dehydrogenase